MYIFLLISWILGIVISIIFAIGSWIVKDKEAWEMSPFVFMAMFLTGYFTTIPLILVVAIIHLNRRFE